MLEKVSLILSLALEWNLLLNCKCINLTFKRIGTVTVQKFKISLKYNHGCWDKLLSLNINLLDELEK